MENCENYSKKNISNLCTFPVDDENKEINILKKLEKIENPDKINLFPQSEIREIEQYFFTENVIKNLVEALEYEENIICLGTPAVADGFFKFKERIVTCLDIDIRFNYLLGFKYFDILNPNVSELDFKPNVLIIDPPFFKLNLVDLFNCVELLTRGDKKTKIIFAFVQREERALLNIFKSYKLQMTKFKLEYRYVEPNRWSNYALYSNYEFNKIKFFDKRNKKTENKINSNSNRINRK